MQKSILDRACFLINQRQFSKAISLLEGNFEVYEDNFEYYFTLGLACLYIGDIGTASKYFQKARTLKLTDTRLLIAQAAIYLRRGDTDRAVRYYLDVLDYDPTNKIAINALEFIRTKGDYDTICQWVDTRRIEKFYPRLGLNPNIIAFFLLFLFICVLSVAVFLFIMSKTDFSKAALRHDLSEIELSKEERKNAQEEKLSRLSYLFLLSNNEIIDAYQKAIVAFGNLDDNIALVEINRIINSNASLAIKQKAITLKGYLKEPTFATLKTNYTSDKVEKNIDLYLDCWVIWTGMISNVESNGNTLSCKLMVGFEDGKEVKTSVPLYFEFIPTPKLEGSDIITVLGKVCKKEDKLYLECKSIHRRVE